MIVPLPVTLLITLPGLPLKKIAPLPGTEAWSVPVARTCSRPEPEIVARASRDARPWMRESTDATTPG
jgi:hypothetical protein